MDHVPSQHQHDADVGARHAILSRSPARLLFAAFALLATAAFLALGIWQMERRGWKLALIARVEARLHAPPAPLAEVLKASVGDADAYRRVRATGTYLHARETLVQALTERGAGFWVLTPMRTAQGIVLVNRGFVPAERRDPATRTGGQIAGTVTVTGLLRISEPRGAFLRKNDPEANRWYSRDVQAIARAQGLEHVAPFFIDADTASNSGGYPIGGLTVIRFPNNHLVYALTWFALAGLSGVALVLLFRKERR